MALRRWTRPSSPRASNRAGRWNRADAAAEPAAGQPGGGQPEPAAPDAAAALDIALRYLANRPRSEQEVRRRLLEAGTPTSVIDTVLRQLRGYRLLDDQQFARYWVEQRQTFRPRGERLLRAELRQHGVSVELAAQVAAEAAPAEEAAYQAAFKRARQLSNVDERTFVQRLGQFLARRGFDWETIGPVVDRLWREQQG